MTERDHDHHDHDHDHPPGGGSHFSDVELRVKALEYLLVEKGLVDPAALDALIDTSSAAIAELRYAGRQGEDMVVRENMLVARARDHLPANCRPLDFRFEIRGRIGKATSFAQTEVVTRRIGHPELLWGTVRRGALALRP